MDFCDRRNWCCWALILIAAAPFVVWIGAVIYAIVNLGKFGCGNLDEYHCAYAVSSGGLRCVLVRHVKGNGFKCTTSHIAARGFNNWRESEACINKCGLQKQTIGIPYDFMSEPEQKLCSNECSDSCPNILDYYYTLAEQQGQYFPNFCEANREMAQAKRSKNAYAGPPVAGRDRDLG